MSKYTTSLKTFCENQWVLDGNKLEGAARKDIINNALPVIFNFSWPIWEESYREHLEYRMISRYYLDEIAFETWGQFGLFLENLLNEKMPYYNTLYRIGSQMGNIFETGYIETVHDTADDNRVKANTGTQKNGGTSKNTGTQVNVGEVKNTGTQVNAGDDGQHDMTSNRDVAQGQDYQSDAYVSNATKYDSKKDHSNTRTDDLREDRSNTRTDDLTRTDDFERKDDLKEENTDKKDHWHTEKRLSDVPDKIGTYAKLWEHYHDIDDMIIDDLQVLFMYIW